MERKRKDGVTTSRSCRSCLSVTTAQFILDSQLTAVDVLPFGWVSRLLFGKETEALCLIVPTCDLPDVRLSLGARRAYR